MSKFIPWDSQPLEQWTAQYARGKLITLDGLQTHYLEQGEEVDGVAPVIFIHGFFYDSYLWNANLAAHRKVYALDLWGFGFSTRQPLDYGYSLYAKQVLQFMDALKIPKATLVGQSMGGGYQYLCGTTVSSAGGKVSAGGCGRFAQQTASGK